MGTEGKGEERTGTERKKSCSEALDRFSPLRKGFKDRPQRRRIAQRLSRFCKGQRLRLRRGHLVICSALSDMENRVPTLQKLVERKTRNHSSDDPTYRSGPRTEVDADDIS